MGVARVGEYSFSQTDVAKTFGHALDLLDLYPAAVHPLQARRRHAVSDAIASDDIETVWRELLAARDDAVAANALPPSATGRVHQISSSKGGVPKLAVESAEIDFSGLVGDRQNNRTHHGRPWQALCIWSTEVIDTLAADGHPIAPGNAGENITVSGLDWSDVTPGVRLKIGTSLCQAIAYAVPCKKNAGWFSDGDFTRIHHRHGPISRVYAVVLEPGRVNVGDAVVLEP